MKLYLRMREVIAYADKANKRLRRKLMQKRMQTGTKS